MTASRARRLEPRERQALGLKYLGYSDKEMARLMGVKSGVPRSYLGAAKHKLGLPAGAPLQLFVYLAGLVESDALPLLATRRRGLVAARGDAESRRAQPLRTSLASPLPGPEPEDYGNAVLSEARVDSRRC